LLQCYTEFGRLAFELLRMRRLSLKEVTARATSPELPKHLKEDEGGRCEKMKKMKKMKKMRKMQEEDEKR